MSFSKTFDMFKDKARVVINDMYIGDEGAHELARFLQQHGRVQSLQIKSNNITSSGFIQIFQALERNPGIRQIIAEYNELGSSDYENWYDALGSLISRSGKLERLNISNNKISDQGFGRIIFPLCQSKSLKLLQIRYNSISTHQMQRFISELKNSNNTCILFVQTAGNKISKPVLQSLQSYLKTNRKNNPISKDKLMMTGGFYDKPQHTYSHNSFTRTNAIDDLSKQNVLAHLQTILDQNRKDTAEMKARLQTQLAELQRKQKIDAKQLSQLDTKCNQLIIQNRNLKFEYDRTISEHQQMERDQEYHLRVHEQKVRQANKQLQQLQNKYQELENRMNKQHDMKMKEIARDWQGRLRSVQQKIRTTENDNALLQNQIRKHMQKRQRLKMEYADQQNIVRTRVQDQQTQRYNFKLTALQCRLQQVEQSRQKYLRRNQDLIYELERSQTQNNREITLLQDELCDLKTKQEQFVAKNKDFVTRNQRLKNQIQMKQLSIEKLQQEINRFNQEIQLKKNHNRQQIQKIITDNQYDRGRRQQDKNQQIQKMTQLQNMLRNAQLQNAKLRQQYAILAQKLQISLGRAVQDVFTQNNLY